VSEEIIAARVTKRQALQKQKVRWRDAPSKCVPHKLELGFVNPPESCYVSPVSVKRLRRSVCKPDIAVLTRILEEIEEHLLVVATQRNNFTPVDSVDQHLQDFLHPATAIDVVSEANNSVP
jgi:hypothetical protein